MRLNTTPDGAGSRVDSILQPYASAQSVLAGPPAKKSGTRLSAAGSGRGSVPAPGCAMCATRRMARRYGPTMRCVSHENARRQVLVLPPRRGATWGTAAVDHRRCNSPDRHRRNCAHVRLGSEFGRRFRRHTCTRSEGTRIGDERGSRRGKVPRMRRNRVDPGNPGERRDGGWQPERDTGESNQEL